jgi:uncharacterized protein (DUF697 family)
MGPATVVPTVNAEGTKPTVAPEATVAPSTAAPAVTPEATVAPSATAPAVAAAPPAVAAAAGITAAEAAAHEALAGVEKLLAETIAKTSSGSIRRHVLMSAATAAIPVNFLDVAALAAVQLSLLADLAGIHKVQFNAEIGRTAIGTLLATVAPTALTGSVLGSMAVSAALSNVPVIGTAVRLLTQPAFNAAFTYTLGKVFHQHFASGGTFLTFDPVKVREYFFNEFKEAQKKGVAQIATGVC